MVVGYVASAVIWGLFAASSSFVLGHPFHVVCLAYSLAGMAGVVAFALVAQDRRITD